MFAVDVPVQQSLAEMIAGSSEAQAILYSRLTRQISSREMESQLEQLWEIALRSFGSVDSLDEFYAQGGGV